MAQLMIRGRWMEKVTDVEKVLDKGGRRAEYPYEEWFSNGPCKLKYGVDFDVKPKSMRTTILQYAERNGIELEDCWVNGDEVMVIPTTAKLKAVRERMARRSL